MHLDFIICWEVTQGQFILPSSSKIWVMKLDSFPVDGGKVFTKVPYRPEVLLLDGLKVALPESVNPH